MCFWESFYLAHLWWSVIQIGALNVKPVMHANWNCLSRQKRPQRFLGMHVVAGDRIVLQGALLHLGRDKSAVSLQKISKNAKCQAAQGKQRTLSQSWAWWWVIQIEGESRVIECIEEILQGVGRGITQNHQWVKRTYGSKTIETKKITSVIKVMKSRRLRQLNHQRRQNRYWSFVPANGVATSQSTNDESINWNLIRGEGFKPTEKLWSLLQLLLLI